MKFPLLAAVAVAGLATLPAGFRANELVAYEGRTVDLGGFRGTVNYAPRGADFVVVATMDNAGRPVRFVTALRPGQKAKVSTPAAAGESELAMELRRDGDGLFLEAQPRWKPKRALHSRALYSE